MALSVDGVSTTDSDGSIAGADGAGLLMLGRNLKSSTTTFFLGLLDRDEFSKEFPVMLGNMSRTSTQTTY